MASLITGQHVLARKRSRLIEDEGQELDTFPLTGFSEHRNKRVNCQSLLSSHDQDADSSGFSFSAAAPVPMVLEPLYSNVEKVIHQTHVTRHFSHMPTPTESSFSELAHQHWAGPGPTISFSDVQPGTECSPDLMDDSVPRSIESNITWPSNAYGPNDTGLLSPETHESRVRHMSVADMNQDYNMEQSLERNLPPRMKVPSLQEPASPTRESGSSPSWKGHNRSRHTLNSWTWQPGMVRSFSVGHHPDCEKCRMKVTGHANHIVIS